MKKKKGLLWFFIFYFIINYNAQTNIEGGDIEGHWVKENSPYIVGGNINIINTLTIDPGTEIFFKKGYKMSVQGKLLAKGTETDSIKFINYNNDQWEGIEFINNASSSEIEYFKLSGVRSSVFPGGALLIDNSNNTRVSHGEIFNNSAELKGAGINLFNLNNYTLSYILLHNNSLYSESDGYSIRNGTAIMVNNSQITLQNITAVKHRFNNSVTNSGTTVHFDIFSEVSFINCIISENESESIWGDNTEDILYITNSNISNLDYYEKRVIGENNYDESPNFYNLENNDFNLKWDNYPNQSNKPREIDGGVKYIHNQDGSVSDIGALTFKQNNNYFPQSVWFGSDKSKVAINEEINFTNYSQKGSENIVSYLWDFGDGNTSTEINPKHKYQSLGKYNVSLKLIDDLGIEKTKEINNFIIVGTVINQDFIEGVWEKSKSPYIVKNDLTISIGKKLIINDGVEVIIDGYFGIKVNGNLKTIGEDSSRISFTSFDRDFFWDRRDHYNYFEKKYLLNGWKGVVFSGNNNDSELIYTDFSYVRNKRMFNFYQEFGVAVWVYNNRNNFLIDNCSFKNNNAAFYGGRDNDNVGAAIRSKDSDLTISNCLFENNIADESIAINLQNTANSKLVSNTFKNNFSFCGDGVVVCGANSIIYITTPTWGDDNLIVFENNLLDNNGGGVSIGGLTANPVFTEIINNVIINNHNTAIIADKNSKIFNNRIINNTSWNRVAGIRVFGKSIIANNFIKGNKVTYYWTSATAIIHESSYDEVNIINNTIIENYNTERYGVNAIFADNSSLVAKNNIVYNNNGGRIGQNVGGGNHPPNILSNNYFDNPNLLTEDSPRLDGRSNCIDFGTNILPEEMPDFDYFGNSRIYGDKIDIGASEWNNNILNLNDNEISVDKKRVTLLNPFKEKLMILLRENLILKRIRIYDINSKLIKSFDNLKLKSFKQYEVELNFIKVGVYYAYLDFETSTEIHKIIKVD